MKISINEKRMRLAVLLGVLTTIMIIVWIVGFLMAAQFWYVYLILLLPVWALSIFMGFMIIKEEKQKKLYQKSEYLENYSLVAMFLMISPLFGAIAILIMCKKFKKNDNKRYDWES